MLVGTDHCMGLPSLGVVIGGPRLVQLGRRQEVHDHPFAMHFAARLHASPICWGLHLQRYSAGCAVSTSEKHRPCVNKAHSTLCRLRQTANCSRLCSCLSGRCAAARGHDTPNKHKVRTGQGSAWCANTCSGPQCRSIVHRPQFFMNDMSLLFADNPVRSRRVGITLQSGAEASGSPAADHHTQLGTCSKQQPCSTSPKPWLSCKNQTGPATDDVSTLEAQHRQ